MAVILPPLSDWELAVCGSVEIRDAHACVFAGSAHPLANGFSFLFQNLMTLYPGNLVLVNSHRLAISDPWKQCWAEVPVVEIFGKGLQPTRHRAYLENDRIRTGHWPIKYLA